MHPIISVVGNSDSGKTTLIEGLIKELRRRDYRVAVIKHAGDDFELDAVSKDSWRFSQAGSEVSAVSSARKLAIVKNLGSDFSPTELSSFIQGNYDLILTEGFKQSDYPKIEIHNKGQGEKLLSPPEQLLAVVTDERMNTDAPQFSRNEVPEIADLIEKTLLTQRRQDGIDLFINGTHVPLSQPAENLLIRTLLAMSAGLKGLKELKSLRIFWRGKS